MRKCLNCGNEIHPFDEVCIVDGKEKCWSCFNTEEFNNNPYFVQYIPNMVTGADREYISFNSIDDLKEKLSKYLDDDFILVKDSDSIMKQSVKKATWWVLGSVKNIEIKDIELPYFNPYIYNDNKNINKKKLQEWLYK